MCHQSTSANLKELNHLNVVKCESYTNHANTLGSKCKVFECYS